MPDVDAIIERLEATVVRADTVTGEKWSGDMVRWSAAEAAVLAAVDARTAEIVVMLKSKAGTDAVATGTAGFYGASYDRAFGSLAAKSAADEVARRFPNGGTNDG